MNINKKVLERSLQHHQFNLAMSRALIEHISIEVEDLKESIEYCKRLGINNIDYDFKVYLLNRKKAELVNARFDVKIEEAFVEKLKSEINLCE